MNQCELVFETALRLNWLGGKDLNPRSPDPESCAVKKLALGGDFQFASLAIGAVGATMLRLIHFGPRGVVMVLSAYLLRRRLLLCARLGDVSFQAPDPQSGALQIGGT
jgi:hypothetical protein